MTFELWQYLLGVITAMAPLALVIALGLPGLFRRFPSEGTAVALVQSSTLTGFLSSSCLLILMLTTDKTQVSIDFGNLVSIPEYHFHLRLLFDRLSVPFVILTFLLCGVISAFASRYLHRETGFSRFLMSYALFVFGMTLAAAAGTIETLFVGWEMVGLSSALLVAFYQDRAGPLNNGLRVWVVYRISDAALLLASIVLHHLHGEGDFILAFGNNWPDGETTLTSYQCLSIGALILLAAAGKSALVPFSGWLPRAMEGPTPSSAIFYGALSVHLGAFLLLRSSPLLDRSPVLSAMIVTLGLVTAIYASLVARVQTDIKSALSFSSLTQVGLIVAEIGLGFRYLALVHLLGHASLRTLQFLRAPSVLTDRQGMVNALGGDLNLAKAAGTLTVPTPSALGAYRWALERGYLDIWLDRFVVHPVLSFFRLCDRFERKWVALLQGDTAVAGEISERRPQQLPLSLEELP